jgi:hypothetical protein
MRPVAILALVSTDLSDLRERRPPAAPASSRRPSNLFLGLVGLVIIAAVVLRVVMLDRQSYWIDEIFSVNETNGSLGHLLRVGTTEVHTPFWAVLLWAWMKIGGDHEAWTRLLSTLFAVATVLISWSGLRSIRLNAHVRWALVVATAASGTSIVYSVDTRSYALLLLASTGLTIATVRAALLTLDEVEVPGRVQWAWAGWVMLAATTHLFGAVLAFAALVVLAGVTLLRLSPRAAVRPLLIWLLLAAIGCSVQAAWLVRGQTQPKFASGTDWILAPTARDLLDLATTTFSAGMLRTHKDGFAWVSPIGVIVVLALILIAAVHGYRNQTSEEPPTGTTTSEAQVTLILVALGGIAIVSSFLFSQVLHLWTLRNLVIVTPALLWGAICCAAAMTGSAAGRRLVAGVAVVLFGVSLVPMASGLDQPYKNDFRGLFEYLISVRAQEPDATFVFLGREKPGPWQIASDRSPDDPAWATVYRTVIQKRRTADYLGTTKHPKARPSGTEVVIASHRVADPALDRRASDLLNRLGPGCRRIPIYGIVVIRCH